MSYSLEIEGLVAHKHKLEYEVRKLRKALRETREDFMGHFDDNCEDCRSAIARIDKALGRK